MRSLVVHHDIGGPGGAELVVAATVKALHGQGSEVELSSVFKYDKLKFNGWFGVDVSYVSATHLLPFRIDSFAIYVRLLVHDLMKRKLSRYDELDVLWVDMPTYGKLKPEIDRIAKHFVEYIHFPLDVMLHDDMMKEGLLFGETEYVNSRYGNPFMGVYYSTYLKQFRKYCRRNPFDYTDIVVANSNWTAAICERLYGKKPKVINPPISSNVKFNQTPPPFEGRKDRFVLLGRFTDEKRYHWVIDEVFPLIKKEAPGAEVAIVGSAGNERSTNYVARLRDIAQNRGFSVAVDMNGQADVRLITNASRELIGNLLDGSKVFMHATANEHWGISVAEAMAAGLPVVVHKSGGAWSDISMEGRAGDGYDDAMSASKAVVGLMLDGRRWADRSSKSVARAKGLTVDNFAKEFVGLLS